MKLEKLFGSSTKVDILKYLIFKRQGISIRALESELEWSFPAIKKQVDLLNEADVINVDKSNSKWSISLNDTVWDLVKKVFMYSLEYEIKLLFAQYDNFIDTFYQGKIFGNNIDIDIVVIYSGLDRHAIDRIKDEVGKIFKEYFIDNISMVFMTKDDFQKRYRMADKFVLSLLNLKQ